LFQLEIAQFEGCVYSLDRPRLKLVHRRKADQSVGIRPTRSPKRSTRSDFLALCMYRIEKQSGVSVI
jgi:hypothetical protein